MILQNLQEKIITKVNKPYQRRHKHEDPCPYEKVRSANLYNIQRECKDGNANDEENRGNNQSHKKLLCGNLTTISGLRITLR